MVDAIVALGMLVEVGGPLIRDPSARRFYTTSSCGVCGRDSLEEVAVNAPLASAGPVIARTCWPRCPIACAT